MNRRNFLNSLIGGVAATAAVRTWPFRVFSFPTEVKPFDWYTSDVIRIDPIWGIGTVKIPNSLDFSDSYHLAVERESVILKEWDTLNRKLVFNIPGRSKEPFIVHYPS